MRAARQGSLRRSLDRRGRHTTRLPPSARRCHRALRSVQGHERFDSPAGMVLVHRGMEVPETGAEIVDPVVAAQPAPRSPGCRAPASQRR